MNKTFPAVQLSNLFSAQSKITHVFSMRIYEEFGYNSDLGGTPIYEGRAYAHTLHARTTHIPALCAALALTRTQHDLTHTRAVYLQVARSYTHAPTPIHALHAHTRT